MPVFVDIAEELAACCAAAGFHEESMVTDSLVLPAAVIQPDHDAIDYQRAMGRSLQALYRFEVVLVFSGVNKKLAMRQLADHVTPESTLIRSIQDIESVSASVVSLRSIGLYEVGSARYFGGSLIVEVE